MAALVHDGGLHAALLLEEQLLLGPLAGLGHQIEKISRLIHLAQEEVRVRRGVIAGVQVTLLAESQYLLQLGPFGMRRRFEGRFPVGVHLHGLRPNFLGRCRELLLGIKPSIVVAMESGILECLLAGLLAFGALGVLGDSLRDLGVAFLERTIFLGELLGNLPGNIGRYLRERSRKHLLRLRARQEIVIRKIGQFGQGLRGLPGCCGRSGGSSSTTITRWRRSTTT